MLSFRKARGNQRKQQGTRACTWETSGLDWLKPKTDETKVVTLEGATEQLEVGMQRVARYQNGGGRYNFSMRAQGDSPLMCMIRIGSTTPFKCSYPRFEYRLLE